MARRRRKTKTLPEKLRSVAEAPWFQNTITAFIILAAILVGVETYPDLHQRFHLALDIGGVTLPVDKAIPCGLMVNELIINAIKHAFPADAPGRVSVSMSSDGGTVTLVVEDDGIGLPAGFDVWAATTLGLQLVCTLAEQLEATLVMREGPGARFQVSFTLEQEIS